MSETAFPFRAAREAAVAGVQARVMRVGFVGEVGYEIHVPADQVLHVWDTLMNAGRVLGIRAVGIEAQRLLRLEKGHLVVGQDTDGLTTPFEAGLAWAIKMGKPFFVGQRSLAILKQKSAKQILVGFVRETQAPMPKEGHLVIDGATIAGRVTSVGWSDSVGAAIGLAYVLPRLGQPGTELQIRIDGGVLVTARVAKPPFYDPEGLRQTIENEPREHAEI